MSAPALGMGQGRALASRSSVASLSTGMTVHKAAMAVIGVFTQADIGDHRQFGNLVFYGLSNGRWTMPFLA
jgi:hypothetical protein